jgi:hypothetical protein
MQDDSIKAFSKKEIILFLNRNNKAYILHVLILYLNGSKEKGSKENYKS